MTARKSVLAPQKRFEKHEAKPISKPQRLSTARCQPIQMARGDGRRNRKPGGPECNRRSAPERKNPHVSQSSAAYPDATKREPSNNKRCGGPNATGQALPIKSRPALQPDATKRDPAGCKNALAQGAAGHQVTRSPSVTRRKAPAANNPRNNVAGHRHLEEQPESKSKRPLTKIRRGITNIQLQRPLHILHMARSTFWLATAAFYGPHVGVYAVRFSPACGTYCAKMLHTIKSH
jgi:hypothetical protein